MIPKIKERDDHMHTSLHILKIFGINDWEDNFFLESMDYQNEDNIFNNKINKSTNKKLYHIVKWLSSIKISLIIQIWKI